MSRSRDSHRPRPPSPPPRLGDSGGWTIDPELDALDLDIADLHPHTRLKTVPTGDIYSAARAGDIYSCARAGDLDRLRFHIDAGVNVNARDRWNSDPLYYACLAGYVDAACMLLKAGAIYSERTFDGDRCHYAALNLRVRRLLKAFQARPPPLSPLPAALRDSFLGFSAIRRAYLEQCEEGAAWAAGRNSTTVSLRVVTHFCSAVLLARQKDFEIDQETQERTETQRFQPTQVQETENR